MKNLSQFFIIDIKKGNTYLQGMSNITSFLNKHLQENLKSAPIFILITLFWSENIEFAIG
jgi:hypothetical protein